MDCTTSNIGITQDIAKDDAINNDATTERITIEDINITTEMNTSQMAIQEQEEISDQCR